MLLTRFMAGMVPFAIVMMGASVACGQAYPDKPVRILTPGPGGTADFTARLASPVLAARLGQPVFVENRPAGLVTETVQKAAPDGYTLQLGGATMWLAPLFQKTSYDPLRDFVPITLTTSAPNILVIHPSLPVTTVRQLITLARARPGDLNYASGGTGSSPHLASELFNSMAGIKIVRVNYKGTAPGLTALMAGEVQVMFATSGATSHVKSGKLRALAVTSAKPSALFPGSPVLAATLPGYESASLVGMFAPANTPAAIINRLNQEFVQILNQPEMKEKLFNTGVEVVASSSQELAATIKSDMARMGKVIKDAGIRAE